MVERQDLDVLKDIPGYKAILKALIKSQIQHLVEQLSSHTDEECVLLTASLSDASLSHLGSDYGKKFLDSHEDVKKQFLGFCLKKQLRAPESPPESQSHMTGSMPDYGQNDQAFRMGPKHRRNRFGPIPGRPRPPGVSPYGGGFRPNRSPADNNKPRFPSPIGSVSQPTSSTTSQQLLSNVSALINENQSENIKTIVKQEVHAESGYSLTGESSGVTEQTSSQTPPQFNFGSSDTQSNFQTGSPSLGNNEENETSQTDPTVKLEPIDQDETDELEITGVELSSLVDGNWGLGNQSATGDQSSENTFPVELYSSPLNPGFFSNIDATQSQRDFNFDQKERKYVCELCNRGFVRKDYLNKHMLLHTGEKPHKCEKCGNAFRQRSHLRMHLVKHAMGEHQQEALL